MEEQRRIVDILEDHLSRLDAATVGLRGSLRRLEALRLSTISAELCAVGGEIATLDMIATRVRNGIFVSRPGSSPDGVPILRIGAVRPLSLSLDDLRYSKRPAKDLATEGSLLDGGDLLFTRYNGNPRFVGACAVVPHDVGPLTYPDKLIRVVVNRELADPDFVAMACSVGDGRGQIQSKVKTTSGQAGISGRDLRGVQIKLPSVASQEQVVERVRSNFEDIRRLELAVSTADQRGRRLRRSLLAAAFSGRLSGTSADTQIVEELAGV
jgi:type I restriction enzyme S subunit